MHKVSIYSLVLFSAALVGCQHMTHFKERASFHAKNTAKSTVHYAKESAKHVGTDINYAKQAVSRNIYFAFDSDKLSPDDQQLIKEHAAYLNNHPNLKVYVVGHSDQRGSQQYNHNLATKRAKTIEGALKLAGVDSGRIQVISQGKNQPAKTGQNQLDWQHNRRAYIHYG